MISTAMAYSGTKLSSDISMGRMANITAWRKDAFSEVSKSDLGAYAGFLRGTWTPLECDPSYVAIKLALPIPTSYLQAEQDRIRQSLLLSLNLTADTIQLPENKAHKDNISKAQVDYINDYKKCARKLSGFVMSTIESSLNDVITGLSDYGELIEHPIYLYNAILILVKVSPELKAFELTSIQKQLMEIKPNTDENIDLYVGRYKKVLALFLTIGGKDLMADRASQFVLSLTSITAWREVVTREYANNQDERPWYNNWAPALTYTNDSAFHTFVTAVQNKIKQAVQLEAVMDRHNAVPTKAEKTAPKAALAATKETSPDEESSTDECGWCKIMHKRSASRHDISTCFAVQVLTQALKKKDSSVFTKVRTPDWFAGAMVS